MAGLVIIIVAVIFHIFTLRSVYLQHVGVNTEHR